MVWIAMALALSPGQAADVTFHRDVAPVLQKHCQSCHRPGEAAPMSFLTYQQTRPWAKAIREAVLTARMPPWFADPHTGAWANDRRLSDADRKTLLEWTASGAKEGDPADAPAPVKWTEGWNIGEPDQVIAMPAEFPIPASGVIDYHYVVLPSGLTEDRWVQAVEVRPGSRETVHHIIAFVREPGSKWLANAQPGVPYLPKDKDDGRVRGQWLVGYAPGVPAEKLRPGQARLLKAGSDIVLQLHYTTNGKPTADRSSVGLVFARGPIKQRVVTGVVATSDFKIPPGAPRHVVKASLTLHGDSEWITLLPHMHLRGKSFEYKFFYPTGESEVVLHVPNYDFNWQLWYEFAAPKVVPKGTRIEVTAVFDNSPNNRNNPDPTQEVKPGEQSWEEMVNGFFSAAIDAHADPRDLFMERKPKPQANE